MRLIFTVGLLLGSSFGGLSAQASVEEAPLWEYGAGLGFVRFEHYPASDEFWGLVVPFPTFQYRGRVLRADDQEGARVYLLKGDAVSLQVSGSVFPPLSSSDNRARVGMEDIPLRGQLGPQLVYRFNRGWEVRLGLYQSIATDLRMTKASGGQAELLAHYGFRSGAHEGRLAIVAMGGSAEFLSTYFGVEAKDARAERPEYAARAGFLSAKLSYFHAYHFGRAALYCGLSVLDYGGSANRGSPLHRSDRNATGIVGLTYVLGTSKREAVPEDETRGILHRRGRVWAE